MKIEDRIKFYEIVNKLKKKLEPISKGDKKLNLGCGNNLLDGYLNVDKQKPHDKYLNIENTPYDFEDESFNEILCVSTLEHITNPLKTIKECHRILRLNGLLIINVPYYNSLKAFSTSTHKSFFSMNSFDCFDSRVNDKRDNHELGMPKFKVKKYLKGSNIGMFIPHKIRNFVGIHIGNVGESIIVVMKKI